MGLADEGVLRARSHPTDADADSLCDEPSLGHAESGCATGSPLQIGPSSGFVPMTARLRMAPSTARLGTARGFADRGRSSDGREGESVFDRLIDDFTENVDASDAFSVRSVFRSISSDVSTNRQDMGWRAARAAAFDAFERLKATLPGRRDGGM